MMRGRQREGSGISLQEMGAEVKNPLLQPAQEEHSTRKIIFKGGMLEKSIYEGEEVPNAIRNQRYSIITFIPVVLYQQFKYFFNLFYLITALSQFIPDLKVGLLFSFLSPLILVLTLTMIK